MHRYLGRRVTRSLDMDAAVGRRPPMPWDGTHMMMEHHMQVRKHDQGLCRSACQGKLIISTLWPIMLARPTKTSPCLRATGPDGGVWDEAEPQNKHHGPGTTLQHQYTEVCGSCCKFSHRLTTVRHSYMLQLPLSAGSSGNQQLTRTTTSLWTADGSTPLH